ncbi:MAG: decarboxylating NADP(+)-dependent phosphogluconate dehydrogenase [Myxococcales bacterium]|nr:decarboxylating NADP(+)-dependent phosphogluconate dehydrogenase [Myxococcales bacterium]
MIEATADIGLIGLAVMGQNLVLNMNDHGYKVSVYNRTTEAMRDFINGPARGTSVQGFELLTDFIASLKRPRRIMLMVKAGGAVDKVIETLEPHLDDGDIIIDGGNSVYSDSNRRTEMLSLKGFRFIGTGVSGGEEGARHGPSIMPGGDIEAWPFVKDIFQSIAAKVDNVPCCDWVGGGGAGHYVKMVHNGIEYGDMQLISEAYHLMKDMLGMNANDMGATFAKWNRGKLDSYLIEITSQIFWVRDDDGEPILEKIRDSAGQKGTGKWTSVDALDQGIPLTLISEAVFARFLSSLKEERVAASRVLNGPRGSAVLNRDAFLNDLEEALYAAKIISYAQGYMLLKVAADNYGWNLNYAAIAHMWRGGCIIRSRFLNDIADAYSTDRNLKNLVLAPFFTKALHHAQDAWRRVISTSVQMGIPTPTLTAALHFFDGYRTAKLPANMVQAQRDFFGAHTYERLDRPRGEVFHTNWTGKGGEVTSGSYDA